MGRLADSLRHADWLDRDRARVYALFIGLASLGIVVAAYLQATGPTGSDFLAFWGAGHVTAAGRPWAAYDLAVQQQVQTATGSAGWFAFVNPPPFLFLATPFGMLPYPVAWLVWVVLGYALWAWLATRAFPRLWPLVLAYPGALIAATHAQTGFITGALLILATMPRSQRPAIAGGTAAALIIKPHLALLIPFWLAAGRHWRVFMTAAVGVLALLLASWLIFGTQTFRGYADSWHASAAIMRSADADFLLRMSSFYAPARLYFGERMADGVALAALLTGLFAAILAWRRFRGDPRASAAAMLAATGIASPYLFNYDLPFLIIPTLWLVDQGLRKGFRSYEKLVLIVLYLAPYGARAMALALGINPMAFASAALLCYVWTRGSEPEAGGERFRSQTGRMIR